MLQEGSLTFYNYLRSCIFKLVSSNKATQHAKFWCCRILVVATQLKTSIPSKEGGARFKFTQHQ